MTLYVVGENEITKLDSTTFRDQKLPERGLQALLKLDPEPVSPDTLIVAEEFSDWEDSQRRIDLLGIDQEANLVVIELKRTEDGGHMELQAVRYAAMISAMSFEALVATFERYLKDNGREREDARTILREHLGWGDTDDEILGQDVKIVLASADFSKEVTTSVLWLNDRGVDIRCVRMRPHQNDNQILLEVQTVIPLPETKEYQIRIREKRQRERESKAKDYSRFDVAIAGKRYPRQNKRNLMLRLVSEVFNSGAEPERVFATLPVRSKLKEFDGELDAEQVKERLKEEGGAPRIKRFFCDDPFQANGKTYVLSNQWGIETRDTATKLTQVFPDLQIEFKESDASNA